MRVGSLPAKRDIASTLSQYAVQAPQEIPNVPDHLRKMVSSTQCPPSNFLAVFPLNGAHRGRLVGTVHDKAAGRRDELTWDDVSKRVIAGMQVDVERVTGSRRIALAPAAKRMSGTWRRWPGAFGRNSSSSLYELSGTTSEGRAIEVDIRPVGPMACLKSGTSSRDPLPPA